MTIKVFCFPSNEIPGYLNNPADGFKINIPVRITEDTGGENNGPRIVDFVAEVVLALGATPLDVYTDVYSQILYQCNNFGMDTPTKADIFAYSPVSMSSLLPDVPNIS